MKEAKALHVMTLIARRSSAWAFDVISTTRINHGEVRDESMQRFAKEITDALDLLNDPDFLAH
jgi:hypothetical protein